MSSALEERLETEDRMAEALADDDRNLIGFVRFGLDMEEFARSTVGKYLIARAEDDLKEALQKLLDMDSLSDTLAAAEAHAQAKVAQRVLRWIDEAITDGKEAERTLIEKDRLDQQVAEH